MDGNVKHITLNHYCVAALENVCLPVWVSLRKVKSVSSTVIQKSPVTYILPAPAFFCSPHPLVFFSFLTISYCKISAQENILYCVGFTSQWFSEEAMGLLKMTVHRAFLTWGEIMSPSVNGKASPTRPARRRVALRQTLLEPKLILLLNIDEVRLLMSCWQPEQ